MEKGIQLVSTANTDRRAAATVSLNQSAKAALFIMTMYSTRHTAASP